MFVFVDNKFWLICDYLECYLFMNEFFLGGWGWVVWGVSFLNENVSLFF